MPKRGVKKPYESPFVAASAGRTGVKGRITCGATTGWLKCPSVAVSQSCYCISVRPVLALSM